MLRDKPSVKMNEKGMKSSGRTFGSKNDMSKNYISVVVYTYDKKLEFLLCMQAIGDSTHSIVIL